MRVGALFSGGKDSTYAAELVSRDHELACLITVFPSSKTSYMFHYPNLRWTGLQSRAMAVPQLTHNTQGVKEDELVDLAEAIRRAKSVYLLEGICTGALASAYQKSRVERVCGELGLKCLSPLWGVDPEAHLARLLDEGFVAMVVGVSALGLTQEWLGRTLDRRAVDELIALSRRNRFHAGLEGGEGETFVLDAPAFKKRVVVRSGQAHWEGDAGYYEITDASLVAKTTRKEQEA
jgi:ABC transporter with metal-binding/Fe-S-binding domain ATP-binding protein